VVLNLGTSEIIVLLLLFVAMFYPQRFQELRRNLDVTLQEFRRGMEEAKQILEEGK